MLHVAYRKSEQPRCKPALAALLTTLALLSSGNALARTDVCYQGGLSLPNFKLLGTAKLNGVDLLVTPDQPTQLGAAVFIPSFAATSDIHVQLKLQITTTVGGGADGMAFVMHRDPRGIDALGAAGGGIGYGGAGRITPSVVVEMDTYQNADPNDNHIGVMVDGDENNHLAVYTPPFRMKSGMPFFVWIDYTAAATRLEVFVAETATKPATAQMVYLIDVAQHFNNQPFYMGFTGSTGGQQSQHEILRFIASDSAMTSAVCCNNDTDCNGSALGPLCDPVKHVCGKCSPTDATACTKPANACNIGAANNTCINACTADYGIDKVGACPSSSAPYCITSGPTAGSCVACNGNYGSGATLACPQGAPSCNASGWCGLCTMNSECTATCNTTTKTCAPCNGDFGSTMNSACRGAGAPFCKAQGFCSSCASDNECATGTHPGPYCNTKLGACSATCTKDSHCSAGQWCYLPASNVGQCLPTIANGQTLPEGATCTPELAMRACQSGACGPANTCAVCASDAQCGAGKVCSNNACVECATDAHCSNGKVCSSNACVECASDTNCSAGKVCSNNTCVECASDTNCRADQECSGNTCQLRATSMYRLSGAGFSCSTAGNAANAGGLAWFAGLSVLGALSVLRRLRARA